MPSILLLAYRRYQNIEPILQSCTAAGCRQIFVSIDGPQDASAVNDVKSTLLVVEKFKKENSIDLKIRISNLNQGCAVSLISACDEILSTEDQLIILEDDCLPSEDFWRFSKEAFLAMKVDKTIGLFCGSQFAPYSIRKNKWVLSTYPHHWGWGITSLKWSQIREHLVSDSKLRSTSKLPGITFSERQYWNAGCKRALKGRTDVWDTLFVREMFRLGLKALLPPNNLIFNVGVEEFAIHVGGGNKWTEYSLGKFTTQLEAPQVNLDIDDWIRRKYFKISWWHLISTRVSALKYLYLPSKFSENLRKRLTHMESNFL